MGGIKVLGGGRNFVCWQSAKCTSIFFCVDVVHLCAPTQRATELLRLCGWVYCNEPNRMNENADNVFLWADR